MIAQNLDRFFEIDLGVFYDEYYPEYHDKKLHTPERKIPSKNNDPYDNFWGIIIKNDILPAPQIIPSRKGTPGGFLE